MSSPQPQDDAMTTDVDAGLLHRVVRFRGKMRPLDNCLTVWYNGWRVGNETLQRATK